MQKKEMVMRRNKWWSALLSQLSNTALYINFSSSLTITRNETIQKKSTTHIKVKLSINS